jgi:hypothetical protein
MVIFNFIILKILLHRTHNRHRFVGREYSGVELKVVKELGKNSS